MKIRIKHAREWWRDVLLTEKAVFENTRPSLLLVEGMLYPRLQPPPSTPLSRTRVYGAIVREIGRAEATYPQNMCTRTLHASAIRTDAQTTPAHSTHTTRTRTRTHGAGTRLRLWCTIKCPSLLSAVICLGGVVNEKWFSKQVAYCRWQTAEPCDLMFRGIRAARRGRW